MTRLEKLRDRARARIQDIGPDDALWLVARVDELTKVAWEIVIVTGDNRLAHQAAVALAALDEP